MVFLGFTLGASILSHSIRLHIEGNTFNSWLRYSLDYDEVSNGVILNLELFKIQLYFSILSNCQDFWFDTGDNYFLRQEHDEVPSDLDAIIQNQDLDEE